MKIKKSKDDIPYIEMAGIKWVSLRLPDMHAILPVYSLSDRTKQGVKVDSFEYIDVVNGILKYKKDLFDFIFIKELKRDE